MQETNLKYKPGYFFTEKQVKFAQRFNMIHRLQLLVALGFMLLFSTVIAAEKSQDPIHIEADRMVSQEQDHAVIFRGNVDARQGELLIRTDEMTVYYAQDDTNKGNATGGDIKHMVCKGNVQISQGDWVGTSGRMDYVAQERKVVLTQNPKALKGQNMVTGEKIIYYLDDGRSVVDGQVSADGQGSGSGRVKAVIQPDANKGK